MSVKNKEETYEKIIEMSKNSDYASVNLLDYEYFSKHYKLITIDLSKQIEIENPGLNKNLISLVNLKKMKQKCFSSLKNPKKQFLNFYKILWVSYKMETEKIINLLNDSANEESKFATKNSVL